MYEDGVMKDDRRQAQMDEWLSAYIDGELPRDQKARLEARLAVDPGLRDQLAALQRTVTLVRDLPLTPAPRNFLLTPSMVAPDRPRPVGRRWLVPALGLATAASSLLLVATLLGSFMSGGRMPLSVQLGGDEGAVEVAMEQPSDTQEAPLAAVPEPAAQEVVEEEEETLRGAPVETPPALGVEMAPTPAPAEYGVDNGEGISDTIAPPAAGGGGAAPTPTATPVQEPQPEAEEVAVTTPTSPAIPPTASPSGADEPLPLPPADEEWSADEEPAAAPFPWLLPGGLALLTLGLAVATAVAWRSRQR